MQPRKASSRAQPVRGVEQTESSLESGTAASGTPADAAKRDQFLLAAIVESSDDAIISKDLHGTIITWNRAAERLFGYTAEEAIGQPVTLMIPADRLHEEADILAQLRAGQRVQNFETVRRRKDGLLVQVSLTISPVKDAQGRIIGASKLARDITEAKRAKEALAQNELRLRAMFDNAAVGIVEVDHEDRFVAVNQRICEMLGYGREEILHRTVHEITAPEDRARSDELNAQLHQGFMESFTYEKRYLKRDGSPLWVHVTVSAVRDLQGRFVRHIGTIEDISERKLAEQERDALVARLRQSAADSERIRAQLEAVFHSMRDGVIVFDMGGEVVLINDAQVRITGYARAEELKRCLSRFDQHFEFMFVDGQPVPPDLWPAARVLRGEPLSEWDLRVRRRDTGQEWICSFSGAPVRDDQGQQVLAIVITRDITQRKQAEHALHEAKEQLARANVDLERKVEERTAKLQELVVELETFSYSIAHDMRAPLRAMLGFADAVLEDYGDHVGPEGKDYLQRIKAAAARQDHFIRDVLDYSRLVRQEIRLEPINLDQLVYSVIAEYPNLNEARAAIEVHSPLGMVLGHGPCLVQCLSNLLGNALKFARPGVAPRVKVWTQQRGENLRIWVDDNGLGIAPQHQVRLFRLFERLHSSSQYPGTGIGLAVVRKAAERLGGTVGLESELGKGSQFWIELKRL